jgi:hypothetical protein
MVHRLANPNEPRNAVGPAPMVASLRFRCACGNQELLSIQVVFDSEVDEFRFVETMKDLWRDMQTEIEQHLVVQESV